jgi:hypothetical protein
LPLDIVLTLLRHADPAIRATRRLARWVVRRSSPHSPTCWAICTAASASRLLHAGHLGRPEAAPPLKFALRQAPSLRVIEAAPPIADEECIVLLGRIARAGPPDLAAAAYNALEAVEHPMAARLLERLGQ